MLALLVLGPPQILFDGQPLVVSRRKSRALLYYVAAQPAPVARERLIALLWPDHGRQAGQQVLRTTLHGLRKELGLGLLVTAQAVSLDAATLVDQRSFLRQIAADTTPIQLTATLDLYRGDFLAGFTLDDSPDYDDWIASEREHLRQVAGRGWLRLGDRYEGLHQWPAALASFERALAFDPLQEAVQRSVLRVQYLAGDRVGAIRRYEAFRDRLDDELGVPPMAATRALYDAIITDTLAPPADPAAPRVAPAPSVAVASDELPFIGRDAELATLQQLIAPNTLVVIEGEAGIGKSRLAGECLRRLDALALAGAAHELEHAMPYQPLIEALRSLFKRPEWPQIRANLQVAAIWLSETARLVPELQDDAAVASLQSADDSRLWEGLYQFLLALAAQRPLVLFIDDLQWADESTLAFLGYLVRQPTAAPLYAVATSRPLNRRSPATILFQHLTRERRLARLLLERLSVGAITALSQQLSPIYGYPLAEWLRQTSEGNPYILVELVRYARSNGLLNPSGVLNLQALSIAPIVPASVASLIMARLGRLSDAARHLLDLAVAVGRNFDYALVARAASLSEEQTLAALAELRSAHIIRPLTERRYTFDHSLTMEVAYRDTDGPHHRLMHRRIAEALAELYADQLDAVAPQLAMHFAEGDAPLRAVPYALRAASQAVALAAWPEAIGFYEQVLAIVADADRLPILFDLSMAHYENGAFARSTETLHMTLSLAQTLGDVGAANAARIGLVRAFIPQGRYSEVIDLAGQMEVAADAAMALQAELLWGTALSLEGADLGGATTHLQRALELCTSSADPGSLAQIKFELGSVAAQQGDLPRALGLYREALAAAEQAGSVQFQILAHNNLAYHLHLLADPSAAEHAQAGLRIATDHGMLLLQPYILSTLGEIALAGGDLRAAEERFSAGLELAERLNIPERIAGLTANLGLVALQQHSPPLAIHRLSTALAQADTLGTWHLAAQIRLWIAPLLPHAEARERIAEARVIAEQGGRQRLLGQVEQVEAQLSVASG